MGELHLSPSAFYEMTLSELMIARQGYWDAVNRVGREQWEQVRWHAAVVANTVPRKGKKSIKPTDLLPFPWDGETSQPAPSRDEQLASLERIKKRDRKRKAWQKQQR